MSSAEICRTPCRIWPLWRWRGRCQRWKTAPIPSCGARLSGGQAQRLALARTLAHPRPVLVLDDPFSALDRSTEDVVFAHLQDYAKDKVVFLISHRLYHFPQLRQVIFMENGKVTVGTHEELMASAPVYRQLYESQTGGKQA